MKRLPIPGAVAGVLAMCASVPAAVLLPASIGLAPLQPVGPLPAATLVSGYNTAGLLTGTVNSWAVVGDPANPYGGVSFYYQVINVGSEAAGRFTVGDFGAAPVDVTTIAAPWDGALPGGVAPAFADRSITGDVVGFDFLAAAQIPSAAWSEVMVVHTASTAWTTGLGAVIDNRSANVSVLVPIPIPEPGALMLLGVASLAVLGKRHRH